MLHLIKDIKNALKNKNYYTALSLALILPDICIHSKQLDGRLEYINWVNKHIFNDLSTSIFAKFRDGKLIAVGTTKEEYENEKQNLQFNESIIENISLNGKIIYALRCSYLHQGTLKINIGKYPINIKLELGILESLSGCVSNSIFGFNENKEVYAKIDVVWLCNEMCKKVKNYYKENKKDFNDLLFIKNIETF